MAVKGENSGSLTPAEMHKLMSIEKLAHNVKDKMTYSVSVPSMSPPPQIPSPFPLR